MEDVTDSERKPWDRQEGEPKRWFTRFDFYRQFGEDRGLEKAYRAYKASPAGSRCKAKRPSGAWYETARKWRWRERAEAWDRYQHEQEIKRQLRDRDKVRKAAENLYKNAHNLAYDLLQRQTDLIAQGQQPTITFQGFQQLMNGIAKLGDQLQKMWSINFTAPLPEQEIQGGRGKEPGEGKVLVREETRELEAWKKKGQEVQEESLRRLKSMIGTSDYHSD